MADQDSRKGGENRMRDDASLTKVNVFVVIDKPLAEYVTQTRGVSRKSDECRVSERERSILNSAK